METAPPHFLLLFGPHFFLPVCYPVRRGVDISLSFNLCRLPMFLGIGCVHLAGNTLPPACCLENGFDQHKSPLRHCNDIAAPIKPIRWTELQEVAGSAAAVPILQNIVNATPDGAVSTPPPNFLRAYIAGFRYHLYCLGGGGRDLPMNFGTCKRGSHFVCVVEGLPRPFV